MIFYEGARLPGEVRVNFQEGVNLYNVLYGTFFYQF